MKLYRKKMKNNFILIASFLCFFNLKSFAQSENEIDEIKKFLLVNDSLSRSSTNQIQIFSSANKINYPILKYNGKRLKDGYYTINLLNSHSELYLITVDKGVIYFTQYKTTKEILDLYFNKIMKQFKPKKRLKILEDLLNYHYQNILLGKY